MIIVHHAAAALAPSAPFKPPCAVIAARSHLPREICQSRLKDLPVLLRLLMSILHLPYLFVWLLRACFDAESMRSQALSRNYNVDVAINYNTSCIRKQRRREKVNERLRLLCLLLSNNICFDKTKYQTMTVDNGRFVRRRIYRNLIKTETFIYMYVVPSYMSCVTSKCIDPYTLVISLFLSHSCSVTLFFIFLLSRLIGIIASLIGSIMHHRRCVCGDPGLPLTRLIRSTIAGT